jgi:hypothetical protein
MATVLLVEDQPDLGLYEADLIEANGHRVIRCSGGPSIFSACPMMRGHPCSLADSADMILFSCRLIAPIRGRTYRGSHLLRAYRAHPVYGRKPMLIVSVGMRKDVGGTGTIEYVEKFSGPSQVLEAVERLVSQLNRETPVVVAGPDR